MAANPSLKLYLLHRLIIASRTFFCLPFAPRGQGPGTRLRNGPRTRLLWRDKQSGTWNAGFLRKVPFLFSRMDLGRGELTNWRMRDKKSFVLWDMRRNPCGSKPVQGDTCRSIFSACGNPAETRSSGWQCRGEAWERGMRLKRMGKWDGNETVTPLTLDLETFRERRYLVTEFRIDRFDLGKFLDIFRLLLDDELSGN